MRSRSARRAVCLLVLFEPAISPRVVRARSKEELEGLEAEEGVADLEVAVRVGVVGGPRARDCGREGLLDSWERLDARSSG